MSRDSSDTILTFQENSSDQDDHVYSSIDYSIVDTNLLLTDSSSIILQNKILAKTPKKSILSHHELQSKNIQPIERQSLNTDWVSAVIIGCFVLLAFSKVFYNKRLGQIFNSFFSSRFQNIMERDGHIFKDRISIPLFLFYTFSTSLFIHQSLLYFLPNFQFPVLGFQLYLIITLLVLFLSVIKILLIFLYGMIFKSNFINSEVIVTNFVFNIVFGILILPIIMIVVFIPSPFFLYVGFFLWLFMLTYKVLRQLITRNPDTKFSLFNRFIYLCTFEIAPTIVLIQLVLNELR